MDPLPQKTETTDESLDIYHRTLDDHERRIHSLERDTSIILKQHRILLADSEEIKRHLETSSNVLTGLKKVLDPYTKWIWAIITILTLSTIIFGFIETTYLKHLAKQIPPTSIKREVSPKHELQRPPGI